MGICIYYEGRLSDPDMIHSFMDQVNFFAEKMNWKAKRFSEEFGDEWHPELVGLSLYPHTKCDTLHFHFDKEGSFVNRCSYK